MNNLLQFWPEKTEVEKFCVHSSEAAHESVTLAVHQELSFQRLKEGGSGSKQKATENDLLSAVLTPSTELTDGFKFIVISGYAGVGKSHYISWINSQLKRSDDADHFHVVWVKKHDTLRTILQSILKPFSDLPEFSRILADLDQAILNNQNNAGYAFQAGINFAIDNEVSSITNELDSLSGKKEQVEKITKKQVEQGFLKNLKNIFNEPDLLNHWTNEQSGVFTRILNQVIQGKNFENIEDEEHLFHAKDLTSAFNDVDPDQLNRGVAMFYRTRLVGTDAAKNIEKSVELLNSLVDKATSFAFQFNQNMGGKSFRDLLNEIRRKLFLQQKELVFLIEDFYAMAGLQDELLPTFIFGGSKEEQICNIRTVLAVTEDFFVNRSTTMSHRKDEFIIERTVSDEQEQIKSALDMVGAYLNATRIGGKNLADTLKSEPIDSSNLDWPPSFQTKGLSNTDQLALDVFDKSPTRGYSLFPFNKHFIVEFLKRNNVIEGSLIFSARGIVRNLLLENLSAHRLNFQNGNFPTKEMALGGTPLHAALESKIQNLSGNQEQRTRFKALVRKWANGNEEVSYEPNFAAVANVFGLKDLWDEYASGKSLRGPVAPDRDLTKAPDVPKESAKEPQSTWQNIEPEKEKRINAWGSVNLNQEDARKFRDHVVVHLRLELDFVDFLKRLGGKIELGVKDIKIPNAPGNRPNASVDVGDDQGGRLRLVYLAFERAALNTTDSKILFDYPLGLEDRAEITEFIEPLKVQIIQNAKVRNVAEASQAAAIMALIEPMKQEAASKTREETGGSFQKDLEIYRVLDDWLNKKKKLVSKSNKIREQFEQAFYVYKGERGDKPLCQNPNDLTTVHNLSDDFTKDFQHQHFEFFNDFIGADRLLGDVNRCINAQKKLVTELHTFFDGADFNFETDKDNFNEFLNAIETRWPGREYTRSTLLAFFNFLEGMQINELLSWMKRALPNTADLPTRIAYANEIDLSDLMRWHFAVIKLGDFFEAVEEKLPSTLGSGDASLYHAQSAVEKSLVSINNVLESVK